MRLSFQGLQRACANIAAAVQPVKMDMIRRGVGFLNGLGQRFRHGGHAQHTPSGGEHVSIPVKRVPA